MIPPEKPQKPYYLESLRWASFVWVAAGVTLILLAPLSGWTFAGWYFLGMSPLLWIASKVLLLLWRISFAVEHGKGFEAALADWHERQDPRRRLSRTPLDPEEIARRRQKMAQADAQIAALEGDGEAAP